MRTLVACAALTLLVGCGNMDDIFGSQNPVKNNPDGGTPPVVVVEPPPPPPPPPVHQNPGDVVVPLNETEQITVGGVEFSILRTAAESGILVARNLNSNEVKLVVDRVNGGGGVVLDETFLANGESISNALDLSDAINYRFSVKVWKSGLDFWTCSFNSDTCYSSSEKKNFTFYDR